MSTVGEQRFVRMMNSDMDRFMVRIDSHRGLIVALTRLAVDPLALEVSTDAMENTSRRAEARKSQIEANLALARARYPEPLRSVPLTVSVVASQARESLFAELCFLRMAIQKMLVFVPSNQRVVLLQQLRSGETPHERLESASMFRDAVNASGNNPEAREQVEADAVLRALVAAEEAEEAEAEEAEAEAEEAEAEARWATINELNIVKASLAKADRRLEEMSDQILVMASEAAPVQMVSLAERLYKQGLGIIPLRDSAECLVCQQQLGLILCPGCRHGVCILDYERLNQELAPCPSCRAPLLMLKKRKLEQISS